MNLPPLSVDEIQTRYAAFLAILVSILNDELERQEWIGVKEHAVAISSD